MSIEEDNKEEEKEEQEERREEPRFTLRKLKWGEEKRVRAELDEILTYTRKEELSDRAYDLIEDTVGEILGGMSDYEKIESDLVMKAYKIFGIIEKTATDLIRCENRYKQKEEECAILQERVDNLEVKYEEVTELMESRIKTLQCKLEAKERKEKEEKEERKNEKKRKEEEEALKRMKEKTDTKEIGIQVRRSGAEQRVEEDLKEVKSRIRRLEELEERRKKQVAEEEGREAIPWTKVLGRKEKSLGKTKEAGKDKRLEERKKEKGREEKIRNQRKKEEKRRKKKEEKAGPIRALKKKLPRGAGVLLEIQGGTPKVYADIIKECQEKISLEGLEIPPLGIKKARGGGILIEVRGEGSEDKAEQLAGRIKKVIEGKEGAKV